MPTAHPTAAPRKLPGSCESASCRGGRYVVAFDVKVIDLAHILVAVCAAFGAEDVGGGEEEYGAIL